MHACSLNIYCIWFYNLGVILLFIFICFNYCFWDGSMLRMQSSFQELEDFPMPFWLTMFVEGTRMTPDKLLDAQEFAASRGLPVPRNVLIPRTKVNKINISSTMQTNHPKHQNQVSWSYWWSWFDQSPFWIWDQGILYYIACHELTYVPNFIICILTFSHINLFVSGFCCSSKIYALLCSSSLWYYSGCSERSCCSFFTESL